MIWVVKVICLITMQLEDFLYLEKNCDTALRLTKTNSADTKSRAAD